MRTVRIGLLTAVCVCSGLCFALPARAQYIGIMQSAETIDKGTFKVFAAPIIAFGNDEPEGLADDDFGIAARGGYGLTHRFDAEGKLGLFHHATYLGVDGELWILKGKVKDTGADFSVTVGAHWILGGHHRFDTVGFDLTPLLSGHVSRNLELCGSLDASFELISDAPAGTDDDFTRLHVVPGFEYRLSDQADLEGEIGIGLNDDSASYIGIGIAFYIR